MVNASETIDFPFGKTLKPEDWGTQAFVYSLDDNVFAITPKKHADMEEKSDRKFEATVTIKDGDINVALPTDFARFYLFNRPATMYVIESEGEKAVIVDATKQMSKLPNTNG